MAGGGRESSSLCTLDVSRTREHAFAEHWACLPNMRLSNTVAEHSGTQPMPAKRRLADELGRRAGQEGTNRFCNICFLSSYQGLKRCLEQ